MAEPDVPETYGRFTKLKGWVRKSLEDHSEWYKNARECYEFEAGRQWTDEEREALLASQRQPVVYNRLRVIVNSICGMEVNNRQDVKYLPRTQGDVEVNERLTSLGDWAREECQAEDEESESFRDLVICGRGWTETRLDYSEDPMGKILVERVDPMECGVDPGSRKANFADSRYRWRYRDLDTAEAEVMFPGVLPQAMNARWAYNDRPQDGGEGNKRDYPEETRSALKEDVRPKTVRVVQVQWWEDGVSYMVAHPEVQAEPKEIDEQAWLAQQEQMEAQGFIAAKVRKRSYYQAFLGNTDILDETDKPCFTLSAMTGIRDRNKGWHDGVVRVAIDPQKIANKVFTQTLRIIDTNAKGGLLAERGVFTNRAKAEQDWSNPTKIVEVAEGALSGNRLKDRMAPPTPDSLGKVLEFSIVSIRDVIGTNIEALGMADREQAASLEYQRRQSAVTILAPLFDALRRYRKTQGMVMIEHLRLLPPGVLVRVISDDDSEQEQAQKPGQPPKKAFVPYDPSYFGLADDQAKFDIIVDEAPSSPNQKEATWAALQPFMGALAENPKAVGVALKYSPLPSAAAQELSEALGGGGIPPQVQQMIQQGQQVIQQQSEQIKQMQQDQSVKVAGAQTNQFKAETDRMAKLGPDDGMPEWFKVYAEQQEKERDRQLQLILQQMKDATSITVAEIGADAREDRSEQMNGANDGA